MKRLPNGEVQTDEINERLTLIAALQQFKHSVQRESNFEVLADHQVAQDMLDVLTDQSLGPSPRLILTTDRIRFDDGVWLQMKVDVSVLHNLVVVGNPLIGYIYSTMLAAVEDLLDHLNHAQVD